MAGVTVEIDAKLNQQVRAILEQVRLEEKRKKLEDEAAEIGMSYDEYMKMMESWENPEICEQSHEEIWAELYAKHNLQ